MYPISELWWKRQQGITKDICDHSLMTIKDVSNVANNSFKKKKSENIQMLQESPENSITDIHVFQNEKMLAL